MAQAAHQLHAPAQHLDGLHIAHCSGKFVVEGLHLYASAVLLQQLAVLFKYKSFYLMVLCT